MNVWVGPFETFEVPQDIWDIVQRWTASGYPDMRYTSSTRFMVWLNVRLKHSEDAFTAGVVW